MTPSEKLHLLLKENGAVAFGAAPACEVDPQDWERFQRWIAEGRHAGMTYMENYPAIRRNPALLLEGARTVISIAFNYRQHNPIKGLATYALGHDYHKVLGKRLKNVVREMRDEFEGEWRVCIDSAPILERYWAMKCRVGYRSTRHGNIVVPGVGSMVFLAELITTLPPEMFPNRNPLPESYPEDCEQGKQVCPTGALMPGGMVDARRCINYLTIEKREPLTSQERQMVGEVIFGCDICQRSCRYNRDNNPEVLPEFSPMDGLEDFLKGRNPEFPLSQSPLKRFGTVFAKNSGH